MAGKAVLRILLRLAHDFLPEKQLKRFISMV
jgi:hypothetical protein